VTDTKESSQIERVAEYCHDQSWAGWMEYLFSWCEANSDGSMTIPAERVQRWSRQMRTPYVELSETEKESDRIEARKILACSRDASNKCREREQ